MEGKGSYFILLVIVAFLSITLAFLAIGYFVFDNHGSTEKEVIVVNEPKIPDDKDLVSKIIFEKTNFNLKKTDEKQVAVIVLSASMKHIKEVEGMTPEEVSAKIDFYSSEIKSAIGTYFQGLTLDDVRNTGWKEKASNELKDEINGILMNNDKKASPLVYSIVFDYSFYQ